jgi:hypothetical protein
MDKTIAIGDRVICRRNDARVDVDNRTRGTIVELTGAGIVLETRFTVPFLTATPIARRALPSADRLVNAPLDLVRVLTAATS